MAPERNLQYHFFPDFGLRGNLAEIHGVQREPAGLEALVVTGDAIFIEDAPVPGIGESNSGGPEPQPRR